MPPHEDPLANNMAEKNKVNRQEHQTIKTEQRDIDNRQNVNHKQNIKNTQNTQGQNTELTTFVNNIRDSFLPRLDGIGRLILNSALNLNNGGEARLTAPQRQIIQQAINLQAPALLTQVPQFGIPSLLEKLREDGISDRHITAFNKLTEIIEKKGGISTADIVNDPELRWLRNTNDLGVIGFVFKKVVDRIMDTTKEIINDRRASIQGLGNLALEIANKMINGGESWSHKEGLQITSDYILGRWTIGFG